MVKMKPSNKVPEEGDVLPYFQPIVSLQTQLIAGYEALGRVVNNGEVRSLGHFFHDPDIKDDDHLRIDRILRNRAMQKLSENENGGLLFINLKPSWIYRQFQLTGTLPTLQFIENHGLDASKIVIEITEEDFIGNLQELTDVIDIYRQQGCKIAIDDVGSGFSNFDRIALIQPDILKIDLNILRRSETHRGYHALLRSFSILAGQMGASLLAEGVETKQDLQNALQIGTRYLQGYLFSKAMPDFMPQDSFKHFLKQELGSFSETEYRKYKNIISVEEALKEFISAAEFGTPLLGSEEADQWISRYCSNMEEHCIRIYICREDGRQLSSNFSRRNDNTWEVDTRFRGANWIWRPYFVPNIMMMKSQDRGTLSQAYTDLDRASMIQTYSCPIGGEAYIFIDLII